MGATVAAEGTEPAADADTGSEEAGLADASTVVLATAAVILAVEPGAFGRFTAVAEPPSFGSVGALVAAAVVDGIALFVVVVACVALATCGGGAATRAAATADTTPAFASFLFPGPDLFPGPELLVVVVFPELVAAVVVPELLVVVVVAVPELVVAVVFPELLVVAVPELVVLVVVPALLVAVVAGPPLPLDEEGAEDVGAAGADPLGAANAP